MNVLVSLIFIFFFTVLLGVFYFYRKYNKFTRLDKNIQLVSNISVNGAKRDLQDVRSSLKNLKEQTNNI